jgi:hypothetical protein
MAKKHPKIIGRQHGLHRRTAARYGRLVAGSSWNFRVWDEEWEATSTHGARLFRIRRAAVLAVVGIRSRREWMTFRNTSIAGVGLIAAVCLLPLAPAAAQAAPEAGRGPAHVMRVQQDLNNNGFKVPVNGVMGAETVAALRQYQRQHGLPASGQIDMQTFTELEGVAPPTVEQGSAQPVAPPPG